MADLVYSTDRHAVCGGCEAYIVLPSADTKDSEIEAGLRVEITGWYGGFIDTLYTDEHEWYLCRSCATKFVRQSPFAAMWLRLPMCPQCKRTMEDCSFQSGICIECEWNNNPEIFEPLPALEDIEYE